MTKTEELTLKMLLLEKKLDDSERMLSEIRDGLALTAQKISRLETLIQQRTNGGLYDRH